MRSVRALSIVALLALAASAAASSYTVKRGDTLASVARRLGVSAENLARASNLKNPNLVIEGQVLTVPVAGTAAQAAAGAEGTLAVGVGGRHVVQRGETLATISRKYGTTVADLVARNGLANANRIVAGRAIAVPGGTTWLCPVKGHQSAVNNWGAPRPGRRSHLGNDIFAARGLPVVAPVSGTLRAASGSVAGLALYLAGDDGNTYYFAHLDQLTRSSGRVDAGTQIGTVGNTGNARALPPHLHFGLQPPGSGPVNPYPVLSKFC